MESKYEPAVHDSYLLSNHPLKTICPPMLPAVPQVTAANEYDATAGATVSELVVVGLPDAPTGVEVTTPEVGKATLKWAADPTNAFIGTKLVRGCCK